MENHHSAMAHHVCRNVWHIARPVDGSAQVESYSMRLRSGCRCCQSCAGCEGVHVCGTGIGSDSLRNESRFGVIMQAQKKTAPAAGDPKAKAIAAIEKAGGSVRPLAQNDE